MKEQIVTIGILVLFLSEGSSAGPTCFDCQRIPVPRDCDHVITCGDHEVCHVTQLVSDSGNLYYDVGCVDALRCPSKRSTLLSGELEEENGDVVTCTSCCHGNFCNSGGCGSQSMAAMSSGSRGPICFLCPLGQITPEQCDKVTVCGRDQSCYIRSVVGFGGDHLAASGCTSSCSVDSVLVGKRDMTSCDGCCHGDFCNMNCSAIQSTHNVQLTSPSRSTIIVTPSKSSSVASTTYVTHVVPTSPASYQVDYEKLCMLFGYTYLPQDHHCYKIYSDVKVTWAAARHQCRHDNGDLFILHNKNEEKLLESLTESPTDAWDTKRYWVGASDRQYEGKWMWVDNTPVNKQYFYPSEPNNGRTVDENCGALSYINKTFLLNDDVCSNAYHFICEINLKDPAAFMSTDVTSGCRNNDYMYANNNGICYKVYGSTTATMSDARNVCQREHADLLQIKDLNTEDFFIHSGAIDTNNQDKRYWVGARRHTDDEFYWFNGHHLPRGSNMWVPGQPDNYKNQEECVNLANVGTFALNDDNCDKHNNFICEERCPNKAYTYIPSLGLCIKVFTQEGSWSEAQAECQRQHTELAEPDSVNKLLFIDWFLNNYNINKYWVGAKQSGPNNVVYWQVSNKPVPPELWSTTQPIFGNSCVVLNHSNRLESIDCNTRNVGFICQHIW